MPLFMYNYEEIIKGIQMVEVGEARFSQVLPEDQVFDDMRMFSRVLQSKMISTTPAKDPLVSQVPTQNTKIPSECLNTPMWSNTILGSWVPGFIWFVVGCFCIDQTVMTSCVKMLDRLNSTTSNL